MKGMKLKIKMKNVKVLLKEDVLELLTQKDFSFIPEQRNIADEFSDKTFYLFHIFYGILNTPLSSGKIHKRNSVQIEKLALRFLKILIVLYC